jgi:predicted nucleic acid-binding protein
MNAVDTNVLIYACDRRNTARQKIALDLIISNAGGALPWQVACEFIAASRKLADQGFTEQDAWNRLAEYMGVLDLKLPTLPMLERARHLCLDKRVAFWDALIIGACQELGVEKPYSEDMPGHVVESPQIVNPFM